jgi:L-cysteine S-thiosulfotransferase
MMRPHRASIAYARLVLCAVTLTGSSAGALEAPISRTALKPGIEFASAEVRAMQRDDFANPAMLWVTRGQRLWSESAGSTGRSCASCHSDAAASMKGVAARYPRIDAGAARLVNVEERVNLCRERHQNAPRLRYESDELLARESPSMVTMRSVGFTAESGIEQARTTSPLRCTEQAPH